MQDIKVENIKKVLEENEDVSFALIFGSFAEDKAVPFSDLDVGVYFVKEIDML